MPQISRFESSGIGAKGLGFTVEVELKERFTELIDLITGEFIERIVRRDAEKIKTAAQANAPYRTGWLHDHIEVRSAVTSTDAIVEVGVDLAVVPYAAHQEFGTVNHPAHPYLRPAIDEKEPFLLRSIGEGVRLEIKKALGSGV